VTFTTIHQAAEVWELSAR